MRKRIATVIPEKIYTSHVNPLSNQKLTPPVDVKSIFLSLELAMINKKFMKSGTLDTSVQQSAFRGNS
jgi:hypothetical protein